MPSNCSIAPRGTDGGFYIVYRNKAEEKLVVKSFDKDIKEVASFDIDKATDIWAMDMCTTPYGFAVLQIINPLHWQEAKTKEDRLSLVGYDPQGKRLFETVISNNGKDPMKLK